MDNFLIISGKILINAIKGVIHHLYKGGGNFIINTVKILDFAFDDLPDADIAGYICTQLENVGRTKVKVIEAEYIPEDGTAGIAPSEQEYINVASLRLDVVVSALFRISRGKAAGLIEGERVMVNWVLRTNAAKPVSPGDMVTLRGYGRAKVIEVAGTTKKDRLRLAVVRA